MRKGRMDREAQVIPFVYCGQCHCDETEMVQDLVRRATYESALNWKRKRQRRPSANSLSYWEIRQHTRWRGIADPGGGGMATIKAVTERQQRMEAYPCFQCVASCHFLGGTVNACHEF